MSEESQAILKLGVPKGSLEDATINLFERAGWKIRKHTRNYFPDINDPEISASLCRVQEIGGYIAAGILDVGITAPAAGCWPWPAIPPTSARRTWPASASPPSWKA